MWGTPLLEINCTKILIIGFYWPTLFPNVYKEVSTCHECHIFDGKRKLLPLPLKPILVEAPFQQWGLDFIGDINPASSSQQKWILTATYYFTKWVEVVHDIAASEDILL